MGLENTWNNQNGATLKETASNAIFNDAYQTSSVTPIDLSREDKAAILGNFDFPSAQKLLDELRKSKSVDPAPRPYTPPQEGGASQRSVQEKSIPHGASEPDAQSIHEQEQQKQEKGQIKGQIEEQIKEPQLQGETVKSEKPSKLDEVSLPFESLSRQEQERQLLKSWWD
jgi:hypothetical protein